MASVFIVDWKRVPFAMYAYLWAYIRHMRGWPVILASRIDCLLVKQDTDRTKLLERGSSTCPWNCQVSHWKRSPLSRSRWDIWIADKRQSSGSSETHFKVWSLSAGTHKEVWRCRTGCFVLSVQNNMWVIYTVDVNLSGGILSRRN